jgi:hypothetical protein
MIIGLQPGKFWDEGKFMCSLFRRDMKIYIYSGADVEYAEACIKEFNNMPQELLDEICRRAVSYCNECLNLWAEIDKRGEIEAKMSVGITPGMPPEKILKCITPVSMSVRESEDGQIGYQVEFDCEFEPEKGMEIVVLGGELLYLGAFGDHSPWDSY